MTNKETLIKYNNDLRSIIHRLTQKYQESGKLAEKDKELLVLLYLTKATKTHAAVMTLCDKGYGEDATVLGRSIFELLVTVKYILADSTDERMNRFTSHDWIFRKEVYNNLDRKELFTNADDKIEEIKASAEAAQKKYSYKPYGGCSDKTMYEMAKEVGEESGFKTCYGIQSSFGHSLARSLNEYMKENNGHRAFDAGSSENYVNFALATVFDFYKSLCIKIDEFLNLGFAEELKRTNLPTAVEVK